MLIGIDMLGVQSPVGGERESGRLGRQLVSALLARDPVNRYVLYVHEGWPTDRVPSARNALRVTLVGGSEGPSKLRPTIQRVLDHNPDGLDWLVLLDPFEACYGGMPPESPLNGVRVASMIADLSPGRVDDRRLAPLRRHDAILTFSESTAAECRRRLPSASGRVKRLALALADAWTSPDAIEPLGLASADELGRLGITGPFLFASMASGVDRSNLVGVVDSYQRLSLEHQKTHQLAIAGAIDNPWAVVAYLHDHGCADGLVLVGEVDEPTLRTLYGRCAAFVSPSFEEGSTLSLVEAMSCGAPVIAGQAGAQPEVVGEAGLFADPDNPAEIADRVASVLSDVDLGRDLRAKARARSTQFTWGPVVEGFLSALAGEDSGAPQPRFRFDEAHVARPRIAVFAAGSPDRSSSLEFNEQVARACLDVYDVDLYFEPADADLFERLPVEFGGFDARQFGRNDGILDYHAVVYLVPDVFALKSRLGRLRNRPGLVLLVDEAPIDRIRPEAEGGSMSADLEAEVACQRLHELFLTSSRLGLRSTRDHAAIQASFPLFADRVAEVPPMRGGAGSLADRGPAMARLLGETEASRGAGLLAGLIEECAADLENGPRRVRRQVSGRKVGSPTGPRTPRVSSAADDSRFESR